MSRSVADLLAWRRERFRLGVYVPLVLFLEAARLALAARPGETFARRAALALLVLFALRAWDDLASAARDGRDHLERILPRAPSKRPFQLAALAAFALAALLAAPSLGRLFILGALATFHAWLYARDARSEQRGLAASFAVLVKYPALAALLSAGEGVPSWRGVVTLALVYACFAVYELAHDGALRAQRGASSVLDAAALTLVAGGIALAGLASAHGVAAALAHSGAAVVGTIVTVSVVRATARDRTPSPALRWLLFVTTAVQLALVATWRP